MALIKCSECGKEVSDQAKTCPHCGYNIRVNLKKISKKRFPYIQILIGLGLCIFISIIYLNSDNRKYNIANKEMVEGDYQSAKCGFQLITNYKDSKSKINECNYYLGYELFQKGEYEECIKMLSQVYGNIEVNSLINRANYNIAIQFMQHQNYVKAFELLLNVDKKYLTNSEDMHVSLKTCIYSGYDALFSRALELYNDEDLDKAMVYFELLCNFKSNPVAREYLNKVKRLSYVQGYWYDRNNYERSVYIDNFTITVSSDNYVILDGAYKFTIDNYTRANGDIVLGMILENGAHITLPDSNNEAMISLVNINATKIDNYYRKDTADKINNEKSKDPQMGMTTEELQKCTWGKPYDINKTTCMWGIREQWCYSDFKYIYLENGVVVGISE